MTQIEHLKKIIQLKEENPELEINFLVDPDELLLDYGWTLSGISSVEITPWMVDGERILTDKDEIIDHLYDRLGFDVPDMLQDEILEEEFKQYDKKSISVRIGAK